MLAYEREKSTKSYESFILNEIMEYKIVQLSSNLNEKFFHDEICEFKTHIIMTQEFQHIRALL